MASWRVVPLWLLWLGACVAPFRAAAPADQPTVQPPAAADDAEASATAAWLEEVLHQAVALAAQERHREALQVIDAARAAEAHEVLHLARIELLRALRDRDAALHELLSLVQPAPHQAAPEMLQSLAELQALQGQWAAARATFGVLRALRPERSALDALAKVLDREGSASPWLPVDLLADLRSAPEEALRRSAFLRIVDGAGAQATELLARAVAIAVADPAPHLRALAVRHAPLLGANLAQLLEPALADAAALVREVALARSAELPPTLAAPMLLRALASCTHSAPLRSLHEALLLAGWHGPDWPAELATPAARAAFVAAWQRAVSLPSGSKDVK